MTIQGANAVNDSFPDTQSWLNYIVPVQVEICYKTFRVEGDPTYTQLPQKATIHSKVQNAYLARLHLEQGTKPAVREKSGGRLRCVLNVSDCNSFNIEAEFLAVLGEEGKARRNALIEEKKAKDKKQEIAIWIVGGSIFLIVVLITTIALSSLCAYSCCFPCVAY